MNTFVRSLTRLRRVWHRGGKSACLRVVLDALWPVRYDAWAARNEAPDAPLARQRARAERLPNGPLLVCVIATAPASDPAALDASIRSVVKQSYDHWQLWLDRTCLEHHEACRLAKRWAARDPRVNVRAAGAPPWSAVAGGSFLMRLESGDTLPADALFEAATALNEHPDTEILYGDEDCVSADGRRRSRPFFKPSWSPELLLSVNYLRHAFIKSTLIEAAGIAVERVEAGWDLALRCAERARHIRRVAKVLYHRRGGAAATPHASELRALEAHAGRLRLVDARASVTPEGAVRLVWRPGRHTVSIVIPNKDRPALLRRCLGSLLTRTRYSDLDIVIVDTGSTDGATLDYYEQARRDRRVRVVDRPGPFNFSAANNAGVQAATGDLLLFLNNDTEMVHEDWLEEMVRWAERPEVGAVGAKLRYPDGSIQHAGMVVGLRGIAHHIFWQAEDHQTGLFGSVDWYRNYLAVTGACMMMRRDVFDRLGGFDERYEVAYSDVDLCLRAVREGFRIVYTPFAVLTHDEGATRNLYAPAGDARRALRDAEEFLLGGDPYFHPALSRRSFVPSLPRGWDRPRGALGRTLVPIPRAERHPRTE